MFEEEEGEEEVETVERGVEEEKAAGGGEEGEGVEGEGDQPMSERGSHGKDGMVRERAPTVSLGAVPHKKRKTGKKKESL